LQLAWMRLPFRYRNQQDYAAKVDEYISQVFYETLPQAGYEVREEQVYTAYRMAGAFANRRVLLAEAPTGTGKTFAYLISAICHARMTGAPVVIACATDVLHHQLAGPGGDIATLSGLLGLQVDTRIAADPRQHLCELKVQALGGVRLKGLTKLLRWAEGSAQGSRTEIPDAPDDLWEMVAWDSSLPCDTCHRRGQCRLARTREHYRQATDLIVCSHDLFFRDLWTRQSRQAADLLPILPVYSAVVLDEGHRALEAAQVAAGTRIGQDELHRTLVGADGVIDTFTMMMAVEASEEAAAPLWAALQAAAEPGQTERWPVAVTKTIAALAAALVPALEGVQVELALVEDQYRTTSDYVHIQSLQSQLDDAIAGLALLQGSCIAWLTHGAGGARSLHVVPHRIADLLGQNLFRPDVPVVLTSATLAGDSKFDYLKRSLGVPGAEHSLVGAPFDMAQCVLVYMPPDDQDRLVALLRATGGRALVLVNSPAELAEVRNTLIAAQLPYPVYWEGVDVPGEALSCVVIVRLPWPVDEPLVRSRRADAVQAGLEPFRDVAVPEMVVKLKQGFGRLIRTAEDRGVLALLDTGFAGTVYDAAVREALPAGAEQTGELGRVTTFLRRG